MSKKSVEMLKKKLNKYFLETERLYLKKLTPIDLDPLYKIFSDPEIMKYSSEKPSTYKQTRRILKTMLADEKKYGFGAVAVLLKDTDEWIGFCGICWEEGKNGELITDFGYSFFKEFWGKGYATESVSACLKYVSDLLPDVELFSYIERNNRASMRVAEKSGMEFVEETIYLNVPVFVYKYVKKEMKK